MVPGESVPGGRGLCWRKWLPTSRSDRHKCLRRVERIFRRNQRALFGAGLRFAPVQEEKLIQGLEAGRLAPSVKLSAAAALGLGTCWVCAFDAALCAEVLKLPEHLEVIVLLPLGYPAAAERPARRRFELDEIVSWNQAPGR